MTKPSSAPNIINNMKNIPLILQAFFAVIALLFPLMEQFNGFSYSTLNMVGGALTTFGLLICLISIVNMGKAFTIMPTPKKEGLRTSGLYQFSRNPIYSGLILLVFGWALLFSNVYSLLSTFGLVASLIWKISYEEMFLKEKYGEVYLQYTRSVGRFTPWF